MIEINNELREIKASFAALEVEADNLVHLSAQLAGIEIMITHLRELIDNVEAKKKREALAQLIVDNGFSARDLRLLDGKAFTRNQKGKVAEANYEDPDIVFDCTDRGEDVPF